MRKYWQIDREILTMLAGRDRMISRIVYGCNLNSQSAYIHLGKLVEQAAVIFVEDTRLWRITAAGREMLHRLEERA